MKLLEAIKDMSSFKDRISQRMYKRWLDVPYFEGQQGAELTNPFYDRAQLELIAWRVVVRITVRPDFSFITDFTLERMRRAAQDRPHSFYRRPERDQFFFQDAPLDI